MSKLEVYLPFPKGLITQRFGANDNYAYARDGLYGHTSYDWGADWGIPIPNCVADAYCYSILNMDNPDPSRYRAVYTLVETETGTYEVSYGHCSAIFARIGQTYQVGETLANVGNTGEVFSGAREVTKQERLNGSHAGSHLHGPQIRPVKKVTKMNRAKHYLSDMNGVYQKDGFYYEVIDFNNGYNGCVSLAPFSTEKVAKKIEAKDIAAVVADVSKAVKLVRTLPSEQQSRWFDPLIQILTSLKKLLK